MGAQEREYGDGSWLGTPSSQPPVDDDAERRPDPADSVVAVGVIPPLRNPVRRLARLMPPMPTDIARGWLVTIVLTAIGGLIRFWDLGLRTDNGTPLFDEKYYAVQAAEMLRTGGVEDNQAYGVIVHPPLGKQLIAVGEHLFGYDPFGWRFATAVAGTLSILLIIRVVRRMTRSTLLGGIAGVLLICDGVSHVMARTALLDVFVELFVLAAFACLIADRDQVRARLAVAVADGSNAEFSGGVPLGARWWRFGAGLMVGAATAVKWNGAYWIPFFGILCVLWTVTARREIGIRRPIVAVIRRDLLPSLWSLAVVPVLAYVGSYWAWFASETGWDRHVDAGTPGLLPAGLRSLVTMAKAMLETSAGIKTPVNPSERHPWESKPFGWPLSTRPLLTYQQGGGGCGAGHTDCVSKILIVGTPAMWWISLFIAAWALWRAIARVDWRYAAVLVAYGAGYLPWFTIEDRQMYFFYMVSVSPFLVIGITLVLGDILGRAGPRTSARGALDQSQSDHSLPDNSLPDNSLPDNSLPDNVAIVSAVDSPVVDSSVVDGPVVNSSVDGGAATRAPVSDDEDGDDAVAVAPDSNGETGNLLPDDPSVGDAVDDTVDETAPARTVEADAPAMRQTSVGIGAARAATLSAGRRVAAVGNRVGIERRLLSVALVCLYVGLVVANFIWMWPILNGNPMTPARATAEIWLPSWG